MQIREDIQKHMRELREWLYSQEDVPLEEMGAFFAARLSDYEQHMAVWTPAYRRFAGLVPEDCHSVLDLGCGTGLELDWLWKRLPQVAVTGVDLCSEMLEALRGKHPDKALTTVCEDYFLYDMGEQVWDAVISFESLHHFLPDKKLGLYRKICAALKPGAPFLLGDYIACCPEEETLLLEFSQKKREQEGIAPEQFVHFDIPLTLEKEVSLLHQAGFGRCEAVDCINGATILCCWCE